MDKYGTRQKMEAYLNNWERKVINVLTVNDKVSQSKSQVN